MIFTKDGEIVHITAHSARMLSRVAFFRTSRPSADMGLSYGDRYDVRKIKKQFEIALRKDANGVRLLHNHPSGIPMPSEADIRGTNWFKDELYKFNEATGSQLQFLGHGIINSNRYGYIPPDGSKPDTYPLYGENYIDPLRLRPESVHRMEARAGVKLGLIGSFLPNENSMKELAWLAKDIQKEDCAVATYLSAHNEIVCTFPLPLRSLQKYLSGKIAKETYDWFGLTSQATGGELYIVLTREQELALVNNDMEAGTQIMKNLEELVVNRYLGNVVIDDISSAKVLIREDSKDDSIEAHGTSPRKVARRMRIR